MKVCEHCGRTDLIATRHKNARFCGPACYRKFKAGEEVPEDFVEKIGRGEYTQKELADFVNYKPNKWQKEVRRVNSRYKVICAGRRSGKSYYVANDPKDGVLADLADGTKYVWIVAPTFDLTLRIWTEVWRTANKHFKPVISKIWNSPGRYRIEMKNGGIIEAKSADSPESLVGVGLDKLIVDEASMVSEKAWTMALRPTLIDSKGSALFISTPKSKNWFYDLWVKGQMDDPEWKSWQFSSFENSYLDKKEVEAAAQDMTALEYEQEILAQFVSSQGKVFGNIAEHIAGDLKGPEPDTYYYMGVDFGGRYDNTAVVVINANTYHVDYVEVMVDTDWPVQKKRIKEIYELYNQPYCTGDATGLGGQNAISELEDMGISIDPFNFSESNRNQLIGNMILFFENGYVTYPPDENLLNELEIFGFVYKKNGQKKYSAPNNKHDDMVMAFALALWSIPKPSENTAESHAFDFMLT